MPNFIGLWDKKFDYLTRLSHGEKKRLEIGMLLAERSDLLVDGRSVVGTPVHERAEAGIGSVPQGREIIPQLTVRKNLLLGLEMKHRSGGVGESLFKTCPILRESLGRRCGELRSGRYGTWREANGKSCTVVWAAVR